MLISLFFLHITAVEKKKKNKKIFALMVFKHYICISKNKQGYSIMVSIVVSKTIGLGSNPSIPAK